MLKGFLLCRHGMTQLLTFQTPASDAVQLAAAAAHLNCTSCIGIAKLPSMLVS
jgi:hypothetical protein